MERITTFSVAIEESTAQAMKVEAAKLNMSRSAFVRKLFEDYIEKQREIDQFIEAMTEKEN